MVDQVGALHDQLRPIPGHPLDESLDGFLSDLLGDLRSPPTRQAASAGPGRSGIFLKAYQAVELLQHVLVVRIPFVPLLSLSGHPGVSPWQAIRQGDDNVARTPLKSADKSRSQVPASPKANDPEGSNFFDDFVVIVDLANDYPTAWGDDRAIRATTPCISS